MRTSNDLVDTVRKIHVKDKDYSSDGEKDKGKRNIIWREKKDELSLTDSESEKRGIRRKKREEKVYERTDDNLEAKEETDFEADREGEEEECSLLTITETETETETEEEDWESTSRVFQYIEEEEKQEETLSTSPAKVKKFLGNGSGMVALKSLGQRLYMKKRLDLANVQFFAPVENKATQIQVYILSH